MLIPRTYIPYHIRPCLYKIYFILHRRNNYKKETEKNNYKKYILVLTQNNYKKEKEKKKTTESIF